MVLLCKRGVDAAIELVEISKILRREEIVARNSAGSCMVGPGNQSENGRRRFIDVACGDFVRPRFSQEGSSNNRSAWPYVACGRVEDEGGLPGEKSPPAIWQRWERWKWNSQTRTGLDCL